MLHTISVKLTRKMMKNLKRIECGEEVYVYGLELILSTMAGILTILFSALFFSVFVESIIFLSVFMTLRIFTGGYHAETYRKCFVCTVGLFWVSILIKNIIMISGREWPWLSLLFVSCIYISLRAPVINKYQPLSDKKKIKNIKKSILVIWIYLFIIGWMFEHDQSLAYMMIVSIYDVGFLMIVDDFIHKRGKELCRLLLS